MLRNFDQKCSDYIRQKPKIFSKSVRTTIRVRDLYSGVLLPGHPKSTCRKSKKVRSEKIDLDWPAWLRMFRSVGVSWWFIINMVKGLRVGSSSASHGLITIK
jgi:hypothetical protein